MRPVGVLLVAAMFGLAAAPPAAAETITLPAVMPSFNQTYTIGPGAWGDSPLGTHGCPDFIRTTGCLITAFSSVLAYYDIDLTIPEPYSSTQSVETGMNPRILNDWLRARRGYGQCAGDPSGACCLEWSELPRGVALSFHSNRSNVGLNAVSAVVIDHALRQGSPVIAGVHWGTACRSGSSQTEDCHWVVLTGKVGDVYTIMDPYNPDHTSPLGLRTTLDEGSRGAYIIDRYVIVSRTPGDPSALNAIPEAPPPSVALPKVPTTPAAQEDPLTTIAVLLVALALVAVGVFFFTGQKL